MDIYEIKPFTCTVLKEGIVKRYDIKFVGDLRELSKIYGISEYYLYGKDNSEKIDKTYTDHVRDFLGDLVCTLLSNNISIGLSVTENKNSG